MKLQPFLLDQWLSEQRDSPVEFNLGGSTGPHWTLRELLQLAGEDARERLLDADVVYPPSAGRASLRQAIAEMREVPAEHVLVVAGGSEALLHVFFLAAEPGANVIVPFPGFPPYHALPESLGLEVRSYQLRRENGYRIDLDEVKRLADASTTLLLVNSPHNPTGATLTDEEMRSLHDFAAGRGIQFVSDEVFHPVYHGPEMASAARLPRATVIGDFSKAFALSGLRAGWIIEPDHRRRAHYLNAREYFSISNTTVGEFFAELAVRHRDVVLGRTREVAGANLQLLDRMFAGHAGVLDWVRPRGGMTAFPRLVNGGDGRSFCQAAVQHGLLLTPGDCFDVPDHFRLGFGVGGGAWYARAIERLEAFVLSWARAPRAAVTA
jgi:aspartate/methionine/tyrosine aminotransferase